MFTGSDLAGAFYTTMAFVCGLACLVGVTLTLVAVYVIPWLLSHVHVS